MPHLGSVALSRDHISGRSGCLGLCFAGLMVDSSLFSTQAPRHQTGGCLWLLLDSLPIPPGPCDLYILGLSEVGLTAQASDTGLAAPGRGS